jgi:hypothetical protein
MNYILLSSLICGLYIVLLNKKNVINLFNNDIFKIIILLIIVSINNNSISIVLSIIYILSFIYSKKNIN